MPPLGFRRRVNQRSGCRARHAPRRDGLVLTKVALSALTLLAQLSILRFHPPS